MSNIINKVLSIFKKKDDDFKGEITSNILFTNDYINLVYDACVISHGGSTDKEEDKKAKFISSIVKLGHGSVLEHSNIVLGIKMDKRFSNDLNEALSLCTYLNTQYKYANNLINIIISGSIRGFRDILNNCTNFDNPVIKEIIANIYTLNKSFFKDFIDNKLLDENMFTDMVIGDPLNYPDIINMDDDKDYSVSYYDNIIEGNKVDLSSIDNISHIYELCNDFFGKDVFGILDLLRSTSITVLFKEASRLTTHQLVRHRNAITQASQRYIDISDNKFLSPDEFKDCYDKNKKYTINLSDGNSTWQISPTLSQLGKIMSSVYSQLRDQGLEKEDARYYSLNGASSSLYMTFNLFTFIKFLALRTDNAAQAEIRMIGDEMYKLFEKYLFENNTELFKNNLFALILPRYDINQDRLYEDVDEEI